MTLLKTKELPPYRVDIIETNGQYSVQVTLANEENFVSIGKYSSTQSNIDEYFDALTKENLEGSFTKLLLSFGDYNDSDSE